MSLERNARAAISFCTATVAERVSSSADEPETASPLSTRSSAAVERPPS